MLPRVLHTSVLSADVLHMFALLLLDQTVIGVG
jgi:hypothetical protein